MPKGFTRWLAFLLFAGVVAAQGPPSKLPTDRLAWPSPSCTVAHQAFSPADNACIAGTSSAGDSDVLGQTASQGSVNLVGTVPGSGKYRIDYYVSQHALCATGSNSVVFTFSWNDGLAARSANSVSLTMGSTQSATTGSIQGVIPIYAAASSSITYTSTVTGSCATGGPASYDAHIAVESVQ